MFSIIILLFLLYFPTPRSQPEHHHTSEHEHHHIIPSPSEILHSEYTPPTHRTAVSVTVANLTYFILGAVITILIVAHSIQTARIWAAWLGVLSMILAAAQYIPQLWVTWRIKVPLPSSLLLCVGARADSRELLPYRFR